MREFLIEKRHLTGMTQANVAAKVGISRAHYTQIENSNRNPSVEVAKKIAALFHFEWTRFFT